MRPLPLVSLTGVVRAPSLSPDGKYVVFAWTGEKHDDPDLYVQQIGAGVPLRLTTDPGNDYSPSWSPDGRTIAFLRRAPSGGPSEVRLIAPLGGPEHKVADVQPRLPSYLPLSMAWCPDSSCVLVTDSRGRGHPDAVFAIAVDTGEKRQLTDPKGRGADGAPAVSPDGRFLVFRRNTTPFSGEFYRLAVAEGMVPQGDPVRLTSTLPTGEPCWTPDSRSNPLCLARWAMETRRARGRRSDTAAFYRNRRTHPFGIANRRRAAAARLRPQFLGWERVAGEHGRARSAG